MKSLFYLKPVLFSVAFIFALDSCEQTRKTQTTTQTGNEDTITVTKTKTKTNTKVKGDLAEFRNWVNSKTSRADSNAKERWPAVKEDFQARTSRLEAHLDTFSEDSKKEYAQLKTKYENWEKSQQERTSQPLDAAKLKTWRQVLLSEHQNLATVNAGNLKETYLLFMGIVRAKKDTWTATDWDYVDHVYSELNGRKSEIDAGISTADRLKIKALQAEYLTLESAADAQDAYKKMKD